MKLRNILIGALIASSVLVGCGKEEVPDTQNPSENVGGENPTTDATTTSSKVNDELTFSKALGANGSWIVIATNNITSDKELILEKANSLPEGKTGRNITLYSNDENQQVKDQYTLTVKRLTIKGDNAQLKRGTFVGDLYVDGNNFEIVATTVKGNVYFMNEEAKNTFKLSEGATVSGVQELKK